VQTWFLPFFRQSGDGRKFCFQWCVLRQSVLVSEQLTEVSSTLLFLHNNGSTLRTCESRALIISNFYSWLLYQLVDFWISCCDWHWNFLSFVVNLSRIHEFSDVIFIYILFHVCLCFVLCLTFCLIVCLSLLLSIDLTLSFYHVWLCTVCDPRVDHISYNYYHSFLKGNFFLSDATFKSSITRLSFFSIVS
jgi:hypothetical protein